MRKRGQASAAATLVGIIGAIIIIYILIIPPEERQRILEGEEAVEAAREAAEEANETLYELMNPIKFLPLETQEFEQTIPNVNIFIYEEGAELRRMDSLYTKKSLFGEKITTMDFEIADIANTQNILLNFLINDGEGRLIIILNGNEIYNNEIKTTNINPIELREYLKQGTNLLEFSVSSPGAAFWKTNEYSLQDLTITADLTRRDAQESRNIFVLTSDEKQTIEKVRFRFLPNCNILAVGRLDVTLNNVNIYSATPDCGYLTIVDLTPNYFVAGENTLRFRTERGRYLIDQIKFTSEIKEVELPIYYFQLTEIEYERVQNESRNITLYMKFTDDVDLKQADIRINGELERLNQRDIEFEININDHVEEGNNAVKIDPDDPIDVVDFKIELVAG